MSSPLERKGSGGQVLTEVKDAGGHLVLLLATAT
jgi:hypothetical protein